MSRVAWDGSKRKRVTVALFFAFGCVLLGFAAANFFPDQTWRALNTVRTIDGIVSWLTPIPSGADRTFQESRIYESVVRDLIGSNPSSKIIFLSVDHSDPSDELIGRLTANGLVVKRASEAHFDRTKGIWTDQSSDREAVKIEVSSIRWLHGDRVEVKGGLNCGLLCGTGGIYALVKGRERWAVAECRDRWVS